MTPVEFPSIGSSLEAAVLGFKETGRQIWLGVKPSQIQHAKGPQKKDSPERATRAIARD
jgi:hypothetical protein